MSCCFNSSMRGCCSSWVGSRPSSCWGLLPSPLRMLGPRPQPLDGSREQELDCEQAEPLARRSPGCDRKPARPEHADSAVRHERQCRHAGVLLSHLAERLLGHDGRRLPVHPGLTWTKIRADHGTPTPRTPAFAWRESCAVGLGRAADRREEERSPMGAGRAFLARERGTGMRIGSTSDARCRNVLCASRRI